MEDKSREGSSTPSQFASQSATTEDLLKSQTVGLVKLADFRKRRAEVLEQKEREAQSGSSTPFASRGASPRPGAPLSQPSKKKKKVVAKGKLSFGLGDDEEDDAETSPALAAGGANPRASDLNKRNGMPGADDEDDPPAVKRLGPNAAVGNAPKAMTKSSIMKEAQTREKLRKEFIVMQEAVKATEILIPYVFYDGTSTPGGVCKVKKGDFVWLFLDRSRKVGATLGDKSKKEWARIGVDDLMLHYDFYYFIVNKSRGFSGILFDYSAQPTSSAPALENGDAEGAEKEYNPLSRPSKPSSEVQQKNLEGADDDSNLTKVVDRRWYERNKHIFPASVWEEFDPNKDYSKGIRKDTKGNNYFFS